eukprot:s1417_g1.t1
MWHELYASSDFERRAKEIQELLGQRPLPSGFNRSNRWRKRGIAQLPTKFGISFTAKFFNQAWNSSTPNLGEKQVAIQVTLMNQSDFAL